MNQVLGVHYRHTGAEIHGSTYHIVVITYTDPVIIRNIRVSKRVYTLCGLVLCRTT